MADKQEQTPTGVTAHECALKEIADMKRNGMTCQDVIHKMQNIARKALTTKGGKQ